MENDVKLKAEPVTAVILRSVKPGCMEEFEMWASGMTQIACNFPGFLSTHVIRPRDIFHPEYVIVVQFDNVNHLETFMTSAERAEYLKKSETMTVGEMSIQEVHGFESFFSLPDHSGQSHAPARYKMAVLTILALYPLLLLISTHHRIHLSRFTKTFADPLHPDSVGTNHDLFHHAVDNPAVSVLVIPCKKYQLAMGTGIRLKCSTQPALILPEIC